MNIEKRTSDLIQALSALLILESTYITSIEPLSPEIERSKLFVVKDNEKNASIK